MIQLFSPLPPEPVLSGAHTWRSLIRHIRLMSLPITKKYMLENNGVPLHGHSEDRSFPEEDPWWTNSGEQNDSDPIPDPVPDSCTGCILKAPVQIVPLADAPKTFERLHPLLIKTKRPLLSEELQHFLCQYPEVTEGFTEGIFAKWWRCFPQRWFPFTYPWTRSLNRSHILRELFPAFTYLPFPKDASLKNCFFFEGEHIERNQAHKMHDLFTIGSGEALLHLIPPFQCRTHCSMLVMPIGPGDIDEETKTQRGEVTIPRPHLLLSKASSLLSVSFNRIKPGEAMLTPTTGISTFWSEGSSRWSSAMQPPSQRSRKQDCVEEQLGALKTRMKGRNKNDDTTLRGWLLSPLPCACVREPLCAAVCRSRGPEPGPPGAWPALCQSPSVRYWAPPALSAS
ncbi:bombesin receptor-activated protein C6orf89 homolog isoform X3 [Artibeus jamaicensis]|nr:bombesin receptor-activated protein C6orf89 homolog isoform X3 [Artibeus jamaicensis]